jgi:nitric oxide reductase NorQ protein
VIPGAKVADTRPQHRQESGRRPVAERPTPLTLDPGAVLARPNGERYLPRELSGHHDVAALRAFAAAGLFVLLAGEPGSGKTALAEAAFPDLIAVQCHRDMTVAHLLGTHLPTEGGGWRWADGPLTEAARTGRPLYLDEVNAMPMDVSTVLHSAMDGRGSIRIDDRPDSPPVCAADGFYVLGSYNPETLAGRRLSEALLSRFSVQVTVSTDFDAARSLGVPEELVTIAENLDVKSRSDRADGGRGVWVPQMRELLAARRLADAGLGLDFAACSLISQCPWPEDAHIVREVGEHVLGVRLHPLQLGAQAW